MKRTLTTALAATVALGAMSTPLAVSAQPYGDPGYRNPCQMKKHKGSTGGAILGALAGAVIGSQVSGNGARTEGSAVGALAGGVVGSQIGRSSAKDSDACLREGYYDNRQTYRTYGQAYYYRDGFYDARGEWHSYDRRYNRAYYQRQYGYGPYYDTYNYSYGRSGW